MPDGAIVLAMPRLQDLRPIAHPSVMKGPYLGRYYGRSRVMVLLRCPRCDQDRERPASEIRQEILRPTYRGHCRPCALGALKDGTHRWVNYRKHKTRYKSHPSGYAYVSPSEVADDLLPMYRAMQRCRQPVLEHRWVMAKHLGRPLTSAECVDHMDGNKTNNAVTNLRIYVRGKQQPGSCPGHGTYYHEWQMAERRIRELEAR